MMFTSPILVRTGPRVFPFMVHCTFAGAPVLMVHKSLTLEPDSTSTVAGAVTLGGSEGKRISQKGKRT